MGRDSPASTRPTPGAASERLVEGVSHADVDRPGAKRAGATSASLSRAGDPVEIEDVLIGAFAAERDEPVPARNVADFERLPDASVEGY